jgi:hypothetical protein
VLSLRIESTIWAHGKSYGRWVDTCKPNFTSYTISPLLGASQGVATTRVGWGNVQLYEHRRENHHGDDLEDENGQNDVAHDGEANNLHAQSHFTYLVS